MNDPKEVTATFRGVSIEGMVDGFFEFTSPSIDAPGHAIGTVTIRLDRSARKRRRWRDARLFAVARDGSRREVDLGPGARAEVARSISIGNPWSAATPNGTRERVIAVVPLTRREIIRRAAARRRRTRGWS